MNERIRELSKQAWEWADQQEYKDPTQEFSDILEQKFAELIIRECTNMLPDDSVRDPNGVHMFYVIRKHFGVSEIGR
jgi:hypothetical protein